MAGLWFTRGVTVVSIGASARPGPGRSLGQGWPRLVLFSCLGWHHGFGGPTCRSPRSHVHPCTSRACLRGMQRAEARAARAATPRRGGRLRCCASGAGFLAPTHHPPSAGGLLRRAGRPIGGTRDRGVSHGTGSLRRVPGPGRQAPVGMASDPTAHPTTRVASCGVEVVQRVSGRLAETR